MKPKWTTIGTCLQIPVLPPPQRKRDPSPIAQNPIPSQLSLVLIEKIKNKRRNKKLAGKKKIRILEENPRSLGTFNSVRRFGETWKVQIDGWLGERFGLFGRCTWRLERVSRLNYNIIVIRRRITAVIRSNSEASSLTVKTGVPQPPDMPLCHFPPSLF